MNSMSADRSLLQAKDLPAETWNGVTLLCTFVPPPSHLLGSVRFVQLTSAGADMWPGHATYEDEKVSFCTSNGIHP